MAAALTAGVAASDHITTGEPDISVFAPDNEVVAGSDTQLELQLENDGDLGRGTQADAVLTARSVSVRVSDDGPFESKSGRTAVGTIPDGGSVPATVRLVVPDDVDPGSYDVEVSVRYSYTEYASPTTQRRETTTERETVTVRVVDEPRFAITDVETAVQPGTSGEAHITVENVGTERANATRATVSGGGGVVLDGGGAEAFLGDLEPGATDTMSFDATLDETVGAEDKPIEARFQYTDSSGIEQESRPVSSGLSPMAAQSFSIEALEDTLSVGYDGHIRGTVRNEGPRSLSDGVLVIEPVSDSLFVEEGRYALPELDSGETTDFEFPTDVSGQADPGPRQVRFSIEYSNDGRSTATAGPRSERVVVDERRGEFSVEADDPRVTAGSSTTLTISITNERPETLSNIDARLYTDSPLSSASDEGFISELEPGESGDLRFELSAARGTMAKTYPVELDFQYDNERGESSLSQTYQQAVEVEEPVESDDGVPLAAIGVGLFVALLAVGGVLWWRQQG